MSLEFEKKLGSELTKLGIDFQYGAAVPGTHHYEEIDFYIKAPVRGLIEIKQTIGSDELAKLIAEKIKKLYHHFNQTIYLLSTLYF